MKAIRCNSSVLSSWEGSLRETFKRVDVDSSGTNFEGLITYTSFVKYFHANANDWHLAYIRHAKGFSIEAAMRLIRETVIKRTGCTQSSLQKVFRVFDVDSSGEVDSEEFGLGLTSKLGLQFDPKLLAEILDQLDTDGNGTIGFDEFFHYVMGMGLDQIAAARTAYMKRGEHAQLDAMAQHNTAM